MTGAAVVGGAVTGGAVTGGAVTGGVVTGGAVAGGAVAGGAVAGGLVVAGAAVGFGAGVVADGDAGIGVVPVGWNSEANGLPTATTRLLVALAGTVVAPRTSASSAGNRSTSAELSTMDSSMPVPDGRGGSVVASVAAAEVSGGRRLGVVGVATRSARSVTTARSVPSPTPPPPPTAIPMATATARASADVLTR